ncbi:cytochrome p450 monooxygenase [Grosmannia clavigera kw1407]|uniref:Cytochrome p450 monooxygenase n=1 Tax=Grosmannia clavigera (strain kw1407 / UAMH 11150) TaxID=655863 RepID=F0XGJ6_GROCL|nr:cytochrome p450 monooxygenase [Grosmannia clavigera kw1407]EFX03155.1 cytochrome p450 monooxygenase [Grosmannia clavigera kw1407]
MLREIAYALLGLTALAYTVEFIFSLFDDPREPPRVKAAISLIGHIIGMIREGKLYYNSLGAKVDSDMYMISILGFKIYVCNSYRLIGAIHKNAKTLAFKPFVKLSMKKNSDVSDHAYEIGSGIMTDKLETAQRAALAPGAHLDAVTLRTAEAMLSGLSALEAAVASKESVMLLAFLRHNIVQALAYGIYGSTHPWKDPKVETAFWTWHEYLPKMFMASLLAGKGFQNRQVVFDAYHNFFQDLPDDTSEVFRERQRVYIEAGIEEADHIKLEAAWPLAIFSNTVPTAYWFMWELCSRPALLAEVRSEVEEVVIKTQKTADGPEFCLDIAALRTRCRLLLSVLEETQRTRHIHASMCRVLEDTVLDERYLLKKGYVVQLPGGPIHHDPNVYGSNAGQFEPHRFAPSDTHGNEGKVPTHAPTNRGFLAWGAPPHLCPARQFAATELLLMASLLILRFDIQLPSGRDRDPYPALRASEIATLLSPKKDVALQMTVREEWRGKWSVAFGKEKSRVLLASG